VRRRLQGPEDIVNGGNRLVMRESGGGVGEVVMILFHTWIFRALYLPTPFPRGPGEFSPADLPGERGLPLNPGLLARGSGR
jgi:hypothetical protein